LGLSKGSTSTDWEPEDLDEFFFENYGICEHTPGGSVTNNGRPEARGPGVQKSIISMQWIARQLHQRLARSFT
jgi:hypothetical protein